MSGRLTAIFLISFTILIFGATLYYTVYTVRFADKKNKEIELKDLELGIKDRLYNDLSNKIEPSTDTTIKIFNNIYQTIKDTVIINFSDSSSTNYTKNFELINRYLQRLENKIENTSTSSATQDLIKVDTVLLNEPKLEVPISFMIGKADTLINVNLKLDTIRNMGLVYYVIDLQNVDKKWKSVSMSTNLNDIPGLDHLTLRTVYKNKIRSIGHQLRFSNVTFGESIRIPLVINKAILINRQSNNDIFLIKISVNSRKKITLLCDLTL